MACNHSPCTNMHPKSTHLPPLTRIQQSARNMLLVEELQNTPAMSFEDGSMVSVWDLYLYTQHNPELKALAEKGINYIPTAEGASRCAVIPWVSVQKTVHLQCACCA